MGLASRGMAGGLPLVGCGLSARRWSGYEVRAQYLDHLHSGVRDAVLAPSTHRWRLDPEHARDGKSPAKGVNHGGCVHGMHY